MTTETHDPSLPDFRSKVVLVYHLGNREQQSSSAIVHGVFETQGGRLFLCGEPAPGDTPNDWVLGCRICVAWDTVESYLVFESLEDYVARCERGRSNSPVQ